MAVVTASGTIVEIGPQVLPTAADSLAEFQAISGWTPIGEVESVGEFGDQANDVTFSAVGDARVRHIKGARDAGVMALVCGHDPLDTGQAALELAEQTKFQFAFRVTLPDSPGTPFTNTILYFRALVGSRRKNIGNNDNIIRNNYNVMLVSEIFTAPSVSA
jgi:Phage tail tube protein, TTP